MPCEVLEFYLGETQFTFWLHLLREWSGLLVPTFSLQYPPAAQFIKQKLPDLLRSYVDADLGGHQEGGFQDIAIEVLHLLLSHLLFGQKGASGVGQEQIDAFLKTLCRGEEQGTSPGHCE